MITSAACKTIINNNEVVIIKCHRHCDFFEIMKLLHVNYQKDSVEQGFIAYDPSTQKEIFLNRVEAWRHAQECGQINSNFITELYSEDLY